jgi:16S rRNA C967 or C1407 C5-methylase (RsmB/RsmF family)/NOL1/NOP2/fmu family ribosome biogenesis protein
MFPEQIMDHLEKAPGFDRAAFRAVHASGEQVVSIRTNPAKWKGDQGISFPLSHRVPWSNNGFYLKERPFFTYEPWLHAGAFYVQEASSMFLEQAIRQHLDLDRPLQVLDGCAAPGGKSTLIQSLLHPGSVLVSNEVIRSRVGVLEENMVKWGAANSIVTCSDPREYAELQGLFDAIVIDAPCSGTGLFRRDPAAASEWSVDLVKLCNQRQQRILADYWPSLKENGLLIYSTCSFSVEEDEDIADWILENFDAESVELSLSSDWNIVHSLSMRRAAHGYRFYPDKLRGEGFFLAAFRKKNSAEKRKTNKRPKWELLPKQLQSSLAAWVSEGQNLTFVRMNENILALSEAVEKMLLELPGIYSRRAGITMGKLAGDQLLPDHALALSQRRSFELPYVDLDRETALRYLRKEEVLPQGKEKGWVLASFAGQSLGWIKMLGNRSNNYYPKDWRILKTG